MKAFTVLVVVVSLLSCASAALSQVIPDESYKPWRETVLVNPKLPPYIFDIQRTGQNTAAIKISGGPKSYRGQTIKADIDDHGCDLDTVDVNFDGYLDFSVLADQSPMGNESYEYWVFDRKTGEFKEAPDFGDITFVDEAHKLLVSYSRGSEWEGITEYYKVEDGEPVEIKSVETAWSQKVRDIIPADIPDFTGVQITRLYRNGKVYRTFYFKAE